MLPSFCRTARLRARISGNNLFQGGVGKVCGVTRRKHQLQLQLLQVLRAVHLKGDEPEAPCMGIHVELHMAGRLRVRGPERADAACTLGEPCEVTVRGRDLRPATDELRLADGALPGCVAQRFGSCGATVGRGQWPAKSC